MTTLDRTLSVAPTPAMEDLRRPLSDMLAAPFDAMRSQYAAAVRAGLVGRSMLQGRDVERVIRSLETLALGPFARRL